jgi:hypothetical protein
MVATEERKIAARKGAAKEEAESSSPNKHPKGKEAKDKTVSEHKSAGKPVRDHAAEHEAKN